MLKTVFISFTALTLFIGYNFIIHFFGQGDFSVAMLCGLIYSISVAPSKWRFVIIFIIHLFVQGDFYIFIHFDAQVSRDAGWIKSTPVSCSIANDKIVKYSFKALCRVAGGKVLSWESSQAATLKNGNQPSPLAALAGCHKLRLKEPRIASDSGRIQTYQKCDCMLLVKCTLCSALSG
jgi:hypothetical protein